MQRYRSAFRSKVIPTYYSGKLHILCFTVLEILAIAFVATLIDWEPLSILYILLSLMYATSFTYFLHKYMLHRPLKGFGWAFKMHHWHHTFYKSRHMEYDHINDIYMLFMPPWLQMLYFFFYLPLLSVLLSLVLPSFIVMHFIFALTLYYAIYELVHWLEHLPATHPLMKIKFIDYMRRHHVVHHSNLKNVANFGIAEPSLDYIFQTKK